MVCFSKNYLNPKIASSLTSLSRQFHLAPFYLLPQQQSFRLHQETIQKKNSHFINLFIYLFLKT